MPDIGSELNISGGITKVLLDMLDQIVDEVLGKQTVDKDGKPLTQVAYMHMPNGLPIDPRQYADPWTPAGGKALRKMVDDGEIVVPPLVAPAADGTIPPMPPTPAVLTPDIEMAQAYQAALNTSWLFDDMIMVTDDGTYRPYPSTRKFSDAYVGLIHSLQPVPTSPPPPEVQAAIDEARKVLYIIDDKDVITGYSPAFKNWETFSQKYAEAKADHARAYARALVDPVEGGMWATTGAPLQQKVDSAYTEWRTSGADAVERAMNTLNSVGGSVAAFFADRARTMFDAWDLSLSGAVPVKTPYVQVTPASWYDHTNNEIGFTTIETESSTVRQHSDGQTSSYSSDWYRGSQQSSGAGASGGFLGISFGADYSSSSSHSAQSSQGSGSSASHFDDSTTWAKISFEYGVCRIQRPWLLTELFHIGGWYIPDQPIGCVSDGTIDGQANNDKKMLPMITTQFLVIRNVTIEASGWGDSGQALSDYFHTQQSSADSSAWAVSGSVGFLGIGGSASHQESEFSGQSSSNAGSTWAFDYNADTQKGKLSINGCQIVGFVGEIVGENPRVDGIKPPMPAQADAPAAAAPADAAAPAGGGK